MSDHHSITLRTYPTKADFKKIPALAELGLDDQWVSFRFRNRRGSDKPTKVPCIADGSSAHADITNPDHWRSYKTALADVRPVAFRRRHGIGFVFTEDDPYWGVDLDNCRNPETGNLTDWAQEVLAEVRTYTEVSPSKTGLKLFGWGPPPGRNFKRGPTEFYSSKRFFTVTGNHLPGTPDTIENPAGSLRWFCERYGGPNTLRAAGLLRVACAATKLTFEDEALLEKARNASNGVDFEILYDDGETWQYGSHSEADLALVGRLIWWTNGDPERTDRLFRNSALMREKWDEDRGGQTYGERTIETALSTFEGGYTGA